VAFFFFFLFPFSLLFFFLFFPATLRFIYFIYLFFPSFKKLSLPESDSQPRQVSGQASNHHGYRTSHKMKDQDPIHTCQKEKKERETLNNLSPIPLPVVVVVVLTFLMSARGV